MGELGTTLAITNNIPEGSIFRSHRCENLKSYMDHIVRKVIETELQPYKMKSEGGFVSANHRSLLFAP
jgi:hypothetical protein